MTEPMKKITAEEIESIQFLARAECVKLYAKLIYSKPDDETVVSVNKAVISMWGKKGLEYIKNNAWKAVNAISTN